MQGTANALAGLLPLLINQSTVSSVETLQMKARAISLPVRNDERRFDL